MVKLGANVLTTFLSPDLHRKEEVMGKSLKGKELGKGISQRKDGLYQARFTTGLALDKLFMKKFILK